MIGPSYTYIKFLEGPVDFLGTESNSILILVLSDSSLVKTSNGALGELGRNYKIFSAFLNSYIIAPTLTTKCSSNKLLCQHL